MAYYLFQWSYSNDSIAGLVKSPQDRAAIVKALVEKLGGKLHGFYYAFGDYDGALIWELADNVTAAALAMAVTSTGGFKTVKTTVLIPADQGVEAMGKAAEITAAYRAPGK